MQFERHKDPKHSINVGLATQSIRVTDFVHHTLGKKPVSITKDEFVSCMEQMQGIGDINDLIILRGRRIKSKDIKIVVEHEDIFWENYERGWITLRSFWILLDVTIREIHGISYLCYKNEYISLTSLDVS